MKTLKDIYELVVGQGMDAGTGTWTTVSPKIKNKMNKYGEYEAFIDPKDFNSFTQEEIDKIKAITIGLPGNPGIDDVSKMLFSNYKEIKYDKSIGYFAQIFAGYVQEGNYRKEATSGGFGTWIMTELLRKGLVDGIIHVREKDNNDEGIFFEYTISDNIEDVKKGSKTRYYPVELSKVLNYVKKNNKRFAIVGIPSFIYSIRLLALQDEIYRERIKYTIGLVCGHQKSANYLFSLAQQAGIEKEMLRTVDFRKKLESENADEYIIEFVYEEDQEEKRKIIKMRNLVGYSWGQGHFKVRASDYTDDVMNETADLTLGDAWIPPYKFDGRGNNVLIVRNPDILEVINEGIQNKKIVLDTITVQQAYASQPGHFRHTVDELPYRIQKRNHDKLWTPENRVDTSKQIPFLRKKVQDIREEIRETSREFYITKEYTFPQYIKKMKKLEKKYQMIYSLIEIRRLGIKDSLKKAHNKLDRR